MALANSIQQKGCVRILTTFDHTPYKITTEQRRKERTCEPIVSSVVQCPKMVLILQSWSWYCIFARTRPKLTMHDLNKSKTVCETFVTRSYVKLKHVR